MIAFPGLKYPMTMYTTPCRYVNQRTGICAPHFQHISALQRRNFFLRAYYRHGAKQLSCIQFVVYTYQCSFTSSGFIGDTYKVRWSPLPLENFISTLSAFRELPNLAARLAASSISSSGISPSIKVNGPEWLVMMTCGN